MANLPSFTSMLQQFKDEVDMTRVLSNFSSNESPEDMFSYLWHNTLAHVHLSPFPSTGQKYEEGALKHGVIAEEKFRTNEFDKVLKHCNLGLMLSPHPKVYSEKACCEMHGDRILQQKDKGESVSQYVATSGGSNVIKEKKSDHANLKETEQQSFDERRDQSVRPKVFNRSQTSANNQEMYGSGRGQDLHRLQMQSTDDNNDVSVGSRIFVKSELSVFNQSPESDERKLLISTQFPESDEGKCKKSNTQMQSLDQDNSSSGASAFITEPISSQRDWRSVKIILEDGSESLMIVDIKGLENDPIVADRDGGDNEGMLEHREIASGEMNDGDNEERGQGAENESPRTDGSEDANESNQSHNATGTSESNGSNQSQNMTESDYSQPEGEDSLQSISSHDSSLADLVERMKRFVPPLEIFEAQQGGLELAGARPEDSIGAEARPEDTIGAEARPEDTIGAEARPEDTIGAEARPEDTIGAEARPEDTIGAEARLEDSVGAEARPEDSVGAEARPEDSVGAETRPEDSVGAETRPEDSVGAETRPEDSVGAETRPEDSVGAETRPEDSVGAETRPEDSVGAETRPQDSVGAETRPQEAMGAETRPQEAMGAETRPQETMGAETRPQETMGAETRPQETMGAETRPQETMGAETRPQETMGAETRPQETMGAETRPQETMGAETRPEETMGAETRPEETMGAEARQEGLRQAEGQHCHQDSSSEIRGRREGSRGARGRREGSRGAWGRQEGSRGAWGRRLGSRETGGRHEGWRGAGGRPETWRGAGGRREGLRGAEGRREGLRGAEGRRESLRGAEGRRESLRGAEGRSEGLRSAEGARKGLRGAEGARKGLRGAEGAHKGLRGAEGRREGLRGAEGRREGQRGPVARQEGVREAEGRQEGVREAEARQEGVREAEARQEGVREAEARQEGVREAEARQEGVREAEARQEGVREAEARQEGVREAEARQEGVREAEARQEGVREAEARQEGVREAEARQEGVREAEARQEGVREAEARQEGVREAEARQEGVREAEARQEGVREAEARQEGVREAEARQEGVREAEARQEGVREAEARQEGVREAEARQEGVREAEARQEGVREAEARQEGVREAEARQEGVREAEARQEGTKGAEAWQEGASWDGSRGTFSKEFALSTDFTSESRGEYGGLGNVTRYGVEKEQNMDKDGSTEVKSQALAVSNQQKPENYEALASFYELRASFLYRIKVYEKSIIDIDMALKYDCSDKDRLILQRLKRNCENDIAKGTKRKCKERGLLFSFDTSEPPVLQERNPVIPVLSSAVKLAYSSRAGRYLVASRDIRPGEVLGVEEPFCATINMNEHTSYCCNCLRRCVTIIPCPNCSLVMFCSEDCAMKDSSHPHWPICNILSTALLLRFSPSGMLVVHLFLKLKFLQMRELRERLLKEEAELSPGNRGMNEEGIYDSADFRTLFHLESHMNSRSPEELLDLTAEAFCITKILVQSRMYFINEQNKPFEPDSDDVVMTGAMVFRLLMKLRSAATSIGELKVVVDNYEKSWVENAGYGVYSAMSLLNHSCYPTASLYNHGKTSVLYSVRSISKGQPITISYGAKYRLVPKEFRLEVLKENYFFYCDCEACKEDWYPDFDNIFELKCVKCERAIDMTRGFCSTCRIFYREGKDYGENPPYNFFQVRDQLTKAAANCKKIKLKILRLGSTEKDRNAIISAIESMEKYVKIPCTVLFDAQDALRISFEREGSYVYVKDHKISYQYTTQNVINSAWTGRRDIAFEQSPKKSPKKKLARRMGVVEPRVSVPDLERSFETRILGSDSRDRNL